jgi:glycosyltransferase involved in cell wall biosynthesis
MKVLIYVGYQKQPFNHITLRDVGLGGTELSCIFLGKELSQLGFDVTIGGEVIDGKWDDLEFKSFDTMRRTLTHYDTVIAASYIHYLIELQDYVKWTKSYLWMHNTEFYTWWNGMEIPNASSLLNSPFIQGVVCLTKWHKEKFLDNYGLVRPMHVIGNGIVKETFLETHKPKIKNSFIYTSAPNRGLERALKMWPRIKKAIPDATFKIYCPSYALGNMGSYDTQQPGIIVKNNMNQFDLHSSMMESEFWLYPTDYEETFCITALEMKYAKVVPIVNRVAALGETVKNGISVSHEGSEDEIIDRYVNAISAIDSQTKDTIIERNYDWVKSNTWYVQALKWKNLIINNHV